MKNRIAVLAVTILCATSSYAQIHIVSGNSVATIERTTIGYHGISVSGPYDVELVRGHEGKLVLKGEVKLLDNIQTEVKNGTLHINPIDDNRYASQDSEGVLIVIPVEEINDMQLAGSGDVLAKATLETHELDIQITGSGDVSLDINTTDVSVMNSGSSLLQLNGITEVLKLRSSGSSDINAIDLVADKAIFQLSGSSDIETTVIHSLTSNISGSGNIRYRGNPEETDNRISGSGRVSRVES